MTNNPDEIRSDIESTRRELGGDVDALADKVSPSKIAHRQTDKVKNALGSARDRVMGTASEGRNKVSSASDTVSETAHTVVEKAQGNPLAVGLIAFGVGWLVASLMPASDKEKEIAASAKNAAQPLVEELAESAKGMAEDMREPAMDAANAVKESAAESVENVKAETSQAAENVKEQAVQSKDAVQEQGS